MLESKIQKKIIDYIVKQGGQCVKITAPSRRGLPDLLALIDGKIILIEVKQEGKTLDPLQDYFFMIWNSKQTNCILCDSLEMLKIKRKELNDNT